MTIRPYAVKSALQPGVRTGPLAYERWRASRLGSVTEALEQRSVLDVIGAVDGGRILDPGCGDGLLTWTLAQSWRVRWVHSTSGSAHGPPSAQRLSYSGPESEHACAPLPGSKQSPAHQRDRLRATLAPTWSGERSERTLDASELPHDWARSDRTKRLRSEPRWRAKHAARQRDRARAVLRENRRPREEPNELLRRLWFVPIPDCHAAS